ncbi:lectin C-type domain protein, partial [Teladorsagia circumcincta]
VFVQRATWDEAEAICIKNNAHLASIESEEENNFIYEITKAKIDFKHDEVLWIGARQKNFPSSREWSWADGKPFKYTNWDNGEPNKGPNGQDLEHCIE